MDLDWAPPLATFLALLAGLLLFCRGRGRSGVSTGSALRNLEKAESRLLGEDSASKASETREAGIDGKDGFGTQVTCPVDDSTIRSEDNGEPGRITTIPMKRCYHFSKPRILPPLPHGHNVDVWEVCSSDDASALLAGCPSNSTVCCGFFKPFADGMNAQKAALDELAAAQPTSFIFAAVDIQSAKEVAAWAGVSEPSVRLLDPTGVVIADFNPAEVKQGILHQKVLSIAAECAKAAESNLEILSRRFPGAMCGEMMIIPCSRISLDKMRQHGLEALRCKGNGTTEESTFQTLCQSCEVSRKPRVREIAAFIKMLRDAPETTLVPFLDLARRLAEQDLIGGTDPGAAEAQEMLVDVLLQRSFPEESCEPAHCMLALQFLVNSIARPNLQEALLPVVGQLVRSSCWNTLWQMSASTCARTHEAAIAVLFNSSVALRSSCCRVEYGDILAATVTALRCLPGNDRINLAVGNLLAAGGTSEDAKRALQAQPLPSLRALSAALYRGELDGPEGSAFPVVWQPQPVAVDRGGQAEVEGNNRRPPRAPIPARHRGRRGGG